jgi:uncharacterized membrane protein YhaH (DUF805 family)
MHWYLKVLRQYADFEGRARRKEYWMYALFNLLALFVAAILDSLLGLTRNGLFGPVYGLYALATFIPGLAVGARRLHDTDRSGWWLLLAIIPLIGAIVLLVWCATEGTRGSNQFGDDPKAGEGGVPVIA